MLPRPSTWRLDRREGTSKGKGRGRNGRELRGDRVSQGKGVMDGGEGRGGEGRRGKGKEEEEGRAGRKRRVGKMPPRINSMATPMQRGYTN